jgi:hypothetical protein
VYEWEGTLRETIFSSGKTRRISEQLLRVLAEFLKEVRIDFQRCVGICTWYKGSKRKTGWTSSSIYQVVPSARWVHSVVHREALLQSEFKRHSLTERWVQRSEESPKLAERAASFLIPFINNVRVSSLVTFHSNMEAA